MIQNHVNSTLLADSDRCDMLHISPVSSSLELKFTAIFAIAATVRSGAVF